MGFWEKHREKAAARRAEQDREEYEAALAAWQTDLDELEQMLHSAEEFDGLDASETASPIALKKGERLYFYYEGAALIEPRRGPGHYQGGSQGFSFPVTKGVRYRMGATRGRYVQGDERPTPIDTGSFTVTDQRIVFQGSKQAREWAFSKLIGFRDDPTLGWTAIPVSNRQKVSGVTYNEEHTLTVRFRMALALAQFQGTRDQLVATVKQELAAHEAQRPLAPPEQLGAPPRLTTPRPD